MPKRSTLRKQPPPRPAPLETDTGRQQDDNIDDLGRRPDGTRHEQPGQADRQAEGEDTSGQ